MPYIGGRLSVNSMKIVVNGRRTHRNFPEVDEWMDMLGSKVEYLRPEITSSLTVKVFGKFKDERRPDLDNLFKAVFDGLKKGLNLDDKDFIPVSEGYETGYTIPGLQITLEWDGKETQVEIPSG